MRYLKDIISQAVKQFPFAIQIIMMPIKKAWIIQAFPKNTIQPGILEQIGRMRAHDEDIIVFSRTFRVVGAFLIPAHDRCGDL